MLSDRDPPSNPIFLDPARGGPYASVVEVNRVLDGIMSRCNTRSRADLGGLTPEEMHRLLHDDWRSPNGAVRLDASLTFQEACRAPVFIDALFMLEYVATYGPLKETAAHNMMRSDVAALLPLLRVHRQRYPHHDPRDRASWNEADVYWLAPLRHALSFAGLIARRSGFRITSRGSELLQPERVGELYARLFLTVFRHLNLRLFDYDRHHGLQATVAYTLYRLGSCARDWASSESLADDAWLASAKDPPGEWEMAYGVDFRYNALINQVLAPLTHFGLLEKRTRWVPGREVKEYRLTQLYDRFLRFEFTAST